MPYLETGGTGLRARCANCPIISDLSGEESIEAAYFAANIEKNAEQYSQYGMVIFRAVLRDQILSEQADALLACFNRQSCNI